MVLQVTEFASPRSDNGRRKRRSTWLFETRERALRCGGTLVRGGAPRAGTRLLLAVRRQKHKDQDMP
jgi:hypothetical protein